jgi:hypothetical protein
VTNGFTWTVTFSRSFGNVSLMTIAPQRLRTHNALTASVAPVTDGVQPADLLSFPLSAAQDSCSLNVDQAPQGACVAGNSDVQTLVLEAAAAAVSGNIVLYYGSDVQRVATTASAAAVAAAVSTLTGISGVSASKWDGSAGSDTRVHWYVTFPPSAGSVPTLLASSEELVESDASAQAQFFDSVLLRSSAERDNIAGTFTLSLGSDTTGSLSFGVTEQQVTTELELLNSVGRVEVVRDRSKRLAREGTLVSVATGGGVLTTTRDLCSAIASGDTFWVAGVPVVRDTACSANSVSLTVAWASPSVSGSPDVQVSAFGYEWRILFKVVVPDGDGLVLDSFRATPNSDWTGTGVRLNVQRPYGRKPLSLVLGARAEIQTVRTRAPRDPSSAGLGFKLALGAQTTSCIAWTATAADVKTALELLSTVERVSVTRSGDQSSASSLYGYLYTVEFWGSLAGQTVDELAVSAIGGACGSFPFGFSAQEQAGTQVLTHTVRDGYALAASAAQYVSLKSSAEYTVAVTPRSARLGFDPAAVTRASTASVVVAPGGRRVGHRAQLRLASPAEPAPGARRRGADHPDLGARERHRGHLDALVGRPLHGRAGVRHLGRGARGQVQIVNQRVQPRHQPDSVHAHYDGQRLRVARRLHGRRGRPRHAATRWRCRR